jgi:hypothetical protein
MSARSRAAERLSVPVGATPGAVTSHFLVELPRTGFVPSSDSVAALNSLVGLGLPVESESRPSLREEVEEFARQYWVLVPGERMKAWLTLCTRSPDDPTANRLLTLQSGLELPGTPFPDTKIEHIAAIARELYVLPPRERAIRRNEWLLANTKRHGELIATAAAMKKDHPAFAALDPDLITRLTPQFHVALFADAATTLPLPERPYSPPKPIPYPSLKSPSFIPKIKRAPIRARTMPRRDKAFLALALSMVFVAFYVFLKFGENGTSSSPGYYSVPSTNSDQMYNVLESPGTITQGNVNKAMDYYYFTDAEVTAFKEYDSGLRKYMPPRYTDWKIAGLPAANERRAKSHP